MNNTIKYYRDTAKEYIEKTIDCNMQAQYDMLLDYIRGGTLLDVGFGSARDMLYFQKEGFDVFGIDPTEEFCVHAKKLGLKVKQESIENYTTNKTFDVIWACASLLHCKDLNVAFEKCYKLLNHNGIMYISLKMGEGEDFVDGRYFHYVTKSDLNELLIKNGFLIVKESITTDALSNRDIKWMNAIIKRKD